MTRALRWVLCRVGVHARGRQVSYGMVLDQYRCARCQRPYWTLS